MFERAFGFDANPIFSHKTPNRLQRGGEQMFFSSMQKHFGKLTKIVYNKNTESIWANSVR